MAQEQSPTSRFHAGHARTYIPEWGVGISAIAMAIMSYVRGLPLEVAWPLLPFLLLLFMHVRVSGRLDSTSRSQARNEAMLIALQDGVDSNGEAVRARIGDLATRSALLARSLDRLLEQTFRGFAEIKTISSANERSAARMLALAIRLPQMDRRLERLEATIHEIRTDVAWCRNSLSGLQHTCSEIQVLAGTTVGVRTDELLYAIRQVGSSGTFHGESEAKAAFAELLANEATKQLQHIEALLQLHANLGRRGYTPLLGDWAIDPVGMLEIAKLIVRTRPSLVVECGGGASTLWIADVMDRLGEGKLISLEHDPTYLQRTASAIAQIGLSHVVDLRHAPLVSRRVGGGDYQWYDAGSFEAGSIELLVIDGPPGKLGPNARYPALPLLAPALADGAHVVLDDANRPDEQWAIRRWLAEVPGLTDTGPFGSRSRCLVYSGHMQ